MLAQHRRHHARHRRRHRHQRPQQKREDHTRDATASRLIVMLVRNMRQRQRPLRSADAGARFRSCAGCLQPVQHQRRQKKRHAGQRRHGQQHHVHGAMHPLLSAAVRATAQMRLVVTAQTPGVPEMSYRHPERIAPITWSVQGVCASWTSVGEESAFLFTQCSILLH